MKYYLPLLSIIIIVSCRNQNETKGYYDNGNIKYVIQLDENGQKHGIETGYWLNGKIKDKQIWNHGELNGVAESYFESGKVEQRGYFKNGLQDSIALDYYESGNIKSMCFYKAGKRNGRIEFYYPSGRVQMIAIAKEDSTISYVNFSDEPNYPIKDQFMYNAPVK